ncbi:MAG: hypothetical protein ACRCXZ_04170 [Patescibacteria group bacterium]
MLSYTIEKHPSRVVPDSILVNLYWYGNLEVYGAVKVPGHNFSTLEKMDPNQRFQLIVPALKAAYGNSTGGDAMALMRLIENY